MIGVHAIWENICSGGNNPFSYGATLLFLMTKCVPDLAALSSIHAAKTPAGDRIMITLEDEAQASAAFIASLLSGLTPVMLPSDIGKERRDSIHQLLQPALVVSDGAMFSAPEGLIVPEGHQNPDHLAYVLFTSGTTAEPSGVEITRGNLFSHLRTLIRLFDFNSRSRVFNPTPVSHTDGLIFGPMLAISTGGAFIRPGPLNLPELGSWAGLLRQHGATHMVTNPTVLSLIYRSAEDSDLFKGEGFRGVISSASLLRPDLWHRFEERFGTQIWNLYGLTETVTSALYAGRHPEMGAVGSLGKPVDCEARVSAVSHGLANRDQAGELELRGDHIFRGYWKNPARTAATFTEDGWMRTGDLVRRQQDGSFVFLGRLKSAINSGGTLIRGEEIDECLLRHPAVLESVTVGMEDAEFEEIAVSAVVLSGEVTEVELVAHCRDALERLKVPKRVIALESIPRGGAGKPILGMLRELIRDRLDVKKDTCLDEQPLLHQQVIDLAALVFRSDPATLSLASGPHTVEGWDSFTHINLILQAETEFAVRIPGSYVTKVRTLGDLVKLIEELKSPR